MRRRTDERMTLSLFPEEDDPSLGELQDAVLRGVNEIAEDEGRRPLQCCTIKMPLPLYLEFKREVQLLRSLSDPETKQHFTMTAFVNAAVKKVILPSIRKADRDLVA
jgi:hypothetical protein